MIDYGSAKFWLDVFQFLFTAGIGLYVWIATQRRVTERDFATRLEKHNTRIATMEERIGHLPSHEDIGKVWEKLDSLHADMAGVQSEMRGVRDVIAPLAKSVDRINDYLLNHK